MSTEIDNDNMQVPGTLTVTTVVATSLVLPLASKSANYAMQTTDQTILLTATGLTATLPDPTMCAGQRFTVKLTAAGTGTVAHHASETIDGNTSYSLTAQYKFVTVLSDGTNWQIVSAN